MNVKRAQDDSYLNLVSAIRPSHALLCSRTDSEAHQVIAVGKRVVDELDLRVLVGLGQGDQAQDRVSSVGRCRTRARRRLGLGAPRDDCSNPPEMYAHAHDEISGM